MKGKTYLLLCALCTFTLTLSARQFEQGEKIYVKVTQDFNWTNDGAHLFLVMRKGDNDTWFPLTSEYNDTIYSAALFAGDWDKCLVVRKNASDSNPGWSNVWNNTNPLDFFGSQNCIKQFWNHGGANWAAYTPDSTKIPDYINAIRTAKKEEHIQICPDALGGAFSLRVSLNAAKTAYNYDDVACHGWYMSTDGTTWSSVDRYAGVVRDEEGDKDIITNTLPATVASGTIYYYLHANKSAGHRLIKLTTDAADCELDCTITFFGVATSEVNANDTTYTLDGMIAFGDAQGKSLTITCDGKSTTITNPQSPQIFSIPGLPAAIVSGKTTIATAQFGNEEGDCKKTATVNIPNATQGIKYTHIDVLVGETTPLNPSGAYYNNDHKWYIDGVEQTTMHNAQTSTAYNEPNTTKYTYREFNPPAGDMSDMMSNGSYEDESFNYGTKGQPSTISDYDYWGQYPQTDNTAIDFYANATLNPSEWNNNGFAIVKDAHNFFLTFANVQARDGQYFALFDAASDGVSGKKAWYATTANNPNLKLQKGTTYLFSFWAANINNYGEMDNAAKLQFQINGKNLGEVLDLNSAEFRNNRWHQCSATYYAEADAPTVTISVVNLNTNTLNTGNDFALDDIQFRAVSSATRSVRLQQVFEVQTHEPHIKSIKATNVLLGCDSTAYKVNITVKYDNPKGNLVIVDQTTGTTVFNGAMPAIGADWDKEKSYTAKGFLIGELEDHQFKAYFAEWPKAADSCASIAPEYPPCCVEGLMFRKWDNVLFIADPDTAFVKYQWYKNREAITKNGNKQFYYTGGTKMEGTTDLYYCEMTTRSGEVVTSCEHMFDSIPSSAERSAVEDLLMDDIHVYPTSVQAGGTIHISKTTAAPLHLTLMTLTGQTVHSQSFTHETSTLTMPTTTGVYLLQITEATNQRIFKIHVF